MDTSVCYNICLFKKIKCERTTDFSICNNDKSAVFFKQTFSFELFFEYMFM